MTSTKLGMIENIYWEWKTKSQQITRNLEASVLSLEDLFRQCTKDA